MFSPRDLFDLTQTEHAALFENLQYAWEALPRLKAYVEEHARPDLRNRCDGRAYIGPKVSIGAGTIVEDGVMIKGPAIIGKNCEIRHNAYIREHVIIGDGCVVGNSCEIKHSILFNNCAVPHFNYVGDSILGHKAHLGAGVKISNIKLVPENVLVEFEGKRIDTGLRKLGAIIGDHTEIGCNAVLNPGSILGKHCLLYPNLLWRGVLQAHYIAKNKAEIQTVARRQAK